MGKLKTYDDPKDFWREVSPFLKKEEAKNNLCLGLAYNFRSNPTDCIYQSSLFHEDQFLGALVVSRYQTNKNFLPSPTSDQSVALQLYNGFQKTGLSITGIIGEKITADIYKSLFEESGQTSQVNMIQGLYRCRKVKMPTYDSRLNFRFADDRDIEKLGMWINDFHREAAPNDPQVDGVELAKARINNQMIFVAERSGQLISMAAWARDIETSCSVNLVYTPMTLRGNGYASVVTAKLTQHLLNSGKIETNLYTDMSNPTSNKIYQKIGYEFVCDSIYLGVS